MRWLFRSLGIFAAKAILDNQILGIVFSRLLLLYLSGRRPTLEDMEISDPSFYKGLMWVLDNDVTHAELNFSTSFEGMFGESTTVALCDDGENRTVTEANKEEYVDLMCNWLSRGRYRAS